MTHDDPKVTLSTPDGLYLHDMEDVLKYFTLGLGGGLQNFTESTRKGFVHALQVCGLSGGPEGGRKGGTEGGLAESRKRERVGGRRV